MIFDTKLEFSDDQAITATAVSTNVIDLGAAGTVYGAAAALAPDIGKGNPIPLLIQVTEVFNTLTSLQVTVEVDDNAAFSSAKIIAASRDILLADLVVGMRSELEFVPRGTDERYVRLRYTVTGTNPTTGKIAAAIVAGVHSND